VRVMALRGHGSLLWLLNSKKTHKHTNTHTHKRTAFRNGLGWFENGGMPIAYTQPRGVHSEHSSRPEHGDHARSVKLSLLLQTARLVYMQGDEDEVRGSKGATESDNLSFVLPRTRVC
jgi:hypothetical protein